MLDFKKTEEEILKFWEKKKIYEKVKKKNSKGKKFYFLQGPPYTSGKIHIGHAWNNSLKDMILRYKRMQGLNVWDRAGYDMHGLPTENAVQKKLGLKTKEEIEKYGMDKFVKECEKFSLEHAEYMNEDLWKFGIWLDHKNAYMPIKKEFISGQWGFFKSAWDQKRLYKGEKVMHWDAETETSLAKHELEYKNVKDTSIFLKFKKKEKENEYFIVWTTTPWTIPYNLAIMVNPDLDYVKVKMSDKGKEEYWILAKALAGAFITGILEKKLEIVDEFKGSEMEGEEYEHFLNQDMNNVYDELKHGQEKIHTVILSKEFVDTTAGTGLVHSAPGCGPEDQEACKPYGIEAFNTLNEQGEIESEGTFKGWTAKEDDSKFIKDFEDKGVLLAKTEVEHEYPHSWRSHKPVVFRTTEQWFLKTEDLIPKLLKFNEKVHWEPKKSGESYDRWTENLKDNGVTRQRFWGCPVPIWVSEDGEDTIVIGSVEELEKETGKKFTDLEVHKPWIDKIVIEKNEKKYKRIPDVSDVWIDSGTASWNCLYNDPKLIKEYFPADLILEATEQTRLWFSMLQICSSIVFGKSSYKNVFAHGMMLDFGGKKMSKSLGNVISPYEVVDKYSVDIFRNFICQVSAGENINFSWDDVKVKQRNLMMLANIANYITDLEAQKVKKGSPGIEEKWILSKYHSTLKDVTEKFEGYKLDETIGDIEDLYVTLSRDYIKYVRDKAGENSSVLETLKEIYLGILKMFCPTVPFVAEELWQKMNQKEESVHLTSWEKVDNKKIDKKLESEFEKAMQVIETGLKERDKAQIGLRWPLAKAEVSVDGKLSKDVLEIIARQLNVKSVALKRGKDSMISVKLDMKMTKELEAEGFAREISRKIQAERKQKGLKKGDLVDLVISSNEEGISLLKENEKFIKERTNSKTLKFVDDKNQKGKNVLTIKEKRFGIKFS
tara:strand:- start:2595 stop:5423 length:2829 start_codon:yes stop_codon:yes gene_type:complete